jgi:hypothetical protein
VDQSRFLCMSAMHGIVHGLTWRPMPRNRGNSPDLRRAPSPTTRLTRHIMMAVSGLLPPRWLAPLPRSTPATWTGRSLHCSTGFPRLRGDRHVHRRIQTAVISTMADMGLSAAATWDWRATDRFAVLPAPNRYAEIIKSNGRACGWKAAAQSALRHHAIPEIASLQSWNVPNLFVQGDTAFPQNAGYKARRATGVARHGGDRGYGGQAVAPNITPDDQTGIGLWSDADFVRAVTQGIAATPRTCSRMESRRLPTSKNLAGGDKTSETLRGYVLRGWVADECSACHTPWPAPTPEEVRRPRVARPSSCSQGVPSEWDSGPSIPRISIAVRRIIWWRIVRRRIVDGRRNVNRRRDTDKDSPSPAAAPAAPCHPQAPPCQPPPPPCQAPCQSARASGAVKIRKLTAARTVEPEMRSDLRRMTDNSFGGCAVLPNMAAELWRKS